MHGGVAVCDIAGVHDIAHVHESAHVQDIAVAATRHVISMPGQTPCFCASAEQPDSSILCLPSTKQDSVSAHFNARRHACMLLHKHSAWQGKSTFAPCCRLEGVLYSLTSCSKELLQLRQPALADVQFTCAWASEACTKACAAITAKHDKENIRKVQNEQ